MGWILTFILLISAVLRGAFIGSVPPELFGDEIDVGYQAFSLFKTGRDLYSQPLPLYIHSLSEWRAPLLIYATVPTITAFGNTELGVRLPEVIFGSLAPLILYLLLFHLSKNKWVSLLAALSLVFLPWHIIYSRVAFEVVIMLDFLMLGTLLYLKKKYFLALLLFGLTPYTYSTAILFTPIFLIILALFTRRLPSIISIILLGLMALPLIYFTLAGPAKGRFNLISVFNAADVTTQVNAYRKADQSPLTNLWHNKIETSFRLVLANYLRGFSTEFLFVRGDSTFRQSLQVIGELLPITAPFLLIGLYWAIRHRQWLMIAWLAVAPIPASLTSDGGYHATRLFLLIPPLCLFIGAGLYQVLSLKPKILLPLFSIIFFIYFSWVANYYLFLYPKLSWRWWHVGYKTAYHQLDHLQSSYSRIFINNTYEPSLIRFLFYTRYPPAQFQKQFVIDQPKPNIVPGYTGFSLADRYFFGTFTPLAAKEGLANHLLPNSLYVISQRDDIAGDWDWRLTPPVGVKVLFTSVNPDNQPILYLITKKI